MEDDLTLLATTRQPTSRVHVDKYLVGYHTMQFMEAGSGGVSVAYDDREFRLEHGGWFWPANPGPRVRFRVAPPFPHWFHRHIGFTGPRVRHWQAVGLLLTEPQPAPPGTDWPAFFDEMMALAVRTDAVAQMRGVNLLERLLLDLAQARSGPNSSLNAEEAWLTQARSRLTAPGVFAPDYGAVAAEVGMSAGTLRRKFRDATGLSPQEYVLQNRVAQARALLIETDKPLKAIAERLGYDSVYFFARQFRQYAGVTPGTFRRSRQR